MAELKSDLAARTRQWCERQQREIDSNIELLRTRPQDVSLQYLYDAPVVFIDSDSIPTTKTRRQADRLFTERIMQASKFKTSKIEDKKRHWQQVLHAAKKAIHNDGTIAVRRNVAHADFSRIRLQVIECAVETGLLWERRSKPGSPKMTRIVPTV